MHNNLDEPFYIYALKGLYAGTKVKHPLLAFFSSVLVFCKVAQRSSSGMGRFDIFFFNWYDPDAIEGTKIIWNTAGCVCFALALRFRASPCIYVTLSRRWG